MTLPPHPELLRAALHYAHRGWPVLPIHPASKPPLTPHGVKDATTNPDQIRRWWWRWPTANIGIATGTPGPQVLDIDDPTTAHQTLIDAPTVATARGKHLYFRGTRTPTIALAYGELRGQSSYVVAPPSTHPTGKTYVWIAEPTGPLPPIPYTLIAQPLTAGAGEHHPPRKPVPYRQRHPYLKDFAVRLTRAGVTDPQRIHAHLQLEFQLSCEPNPPPAPRSLEQLAQWAATSRIAYRENHRQRTDG